MSVNIDGMNYAADMVVSVGSFRGLQEFRQIKQVLAVNPYIVFICKPITAWYHDLVCAYELTQSSAGLVATHMT